MKASTVATISGVTLVTGLVAYAAYFDYRRRNDANFRKSLGKDYKRMKKAEAKRQAASASHVETAIAAAVASTHAMESDGRIPRDEVGRESYFMEQVSIGEALFAMGADRHMDAATAFFRALKVYPQPIELLMIYQKTVPEPVLELVVKMIAKDTGNSGSSVLGANPLAAMGLASMGSAGGASGGPSGQQLEELDDEAPVASSTSSAEAGTASASSDAAPGLGSASGDNHSSPEWDTLSGESLGPNAGASSSAPAAEATSPQPKTDPVHFGFGSSPTDPKPTESEEKPSQTE